MNKRTNKQKEAPAGELALQVETLPVRLDSLSSIPKTHPVERGKGTHFLKLVPDLHAPAWHLSSHIQHTQTHMHTQSK